MPNADDGDGSLDDDDFDKIGNSVSISSLLSLRRYHKRTFWLKSAFMCFQDVEEEKENEKETDAVK